MKILEWFINTKVAQILYKDKTNLHMMKFSNSLVTKVKK